MLHKGHGGAGAVFAALALSATASASAVPSATCGALAGGGIIPWRGDAVRIVQARWLAAGPDGTIPAHCEIIGVMHERVGVDGQHYAIRIHLRLPDRWNGRFFFQGGGGSNGELGDALGRLVPGAPSALKQGYAVLSQDSGHDNATNTVRDRGGASAFGFDPQARADYGGTSLPAATVAALATIRRYYGRKPAFSYFVGCSKGGQEGMMLAQRYPALFDGIVAAAPGFALPRAAAAKAWGTQVLADVVRQSGQSVTPVTLANAFSDGDLALLQKAVLGACDGLDGLADGIIADTRACTSARVLPELARVTCSAAKQDTCLASAQVKALVRLHDGPADGRGQVFYAGLPWDAGWGTPGWRAWLLGDRVHGISVGLKMGAPSLGAIFTTPPTAIDTSTGLDAALAFVLNFDIARADAQITAVAPPFVRSSWRDIGAQSTDLSAFRARGGRMIVLHGASDPAFSLADTLNWVKAVDARMPGGSQGVLRTFAVPGMNHCAGGPATDEIPAFAALVDWVEHHRAPRRIIARAGAASPWPGRERPLCVWPAAAIYDGHGNPEKSASVHCRLRAES